MSSPPAGPPFSLIFQSLKHITKHCFKKVPFRRTCAKMTPKVVPKDPQKETKIHRKSSKSRLREAVGAHRQLLTSKSGPVGGYPLKIHLKSTEKPLTYGGGKLTQTFRTPAEKIPGWVGGGLFRPSWAQASRAELYGGSRVELCQPVPGQAEPRPGKSSWAMPGPG